jgi:hypothetical protein
VKKVSEEERRLRDRMREMREEKWYKRDERR